jgi:hypothetical protein
MGQSLRQNFEQLLSELPAFRQDLGKVVQAAIEEEPALRESLGELLQGFDTSMAEVQETMPDALAGLEKDMASLEPGIAELRQSIAEAEQALAAGTAAAVVAVPAAFVALPAGHGQMLRTELLQRFAPGQTAAPVVPASGDVHDLTSGDWKHAAPEPPKAKPARPTGIRPPQSKPTGDDIGDMNSQDWR